MKARIAPTPSGYLHRGNIANFLLNARLAEGGELLLRIDDLDRARFRPEYLEDIFRVVDWLGVNITEGPSGPEDFARSWSQEYRMAAYQNALDQLRGHPLVFACPCTRKELAGGKHRHGCLSGKVPLDSRNAAWRVDTREVGTINIPDLVESAGFSVFTHSEISEFVIRKKDGRPSYQLACTVDDVLFGVDRVGRGRDLLASTAAQAVVSDLLGYAPLFERVTFLHHPLVAGGGGEKLSKSAGAQGEPLQLEEALRGQLDQLAQSWLPAAKH